MINSQQNQTVTLQHQKKTNYWYLNVIGNELNLQYYKREIIAVPDATQERTCDHEEKKLIYHTN